MNPFSDNFFGYKLIDLLGDLLKTLFVPSEERLTALTDSVKSHFTFVDTINVAINSLKDVINNVGQAPSLTIELGSTKYTEVTTFTFDLSWYAPFKKYADLIITGFCYAGFIWRVFTHMPGTLQGASGTIEFVSNKGGKL